MKLSIDFLTGKIAYRRAQNGKELLAKAVGIKGCYRPSILDATAGLGRDGFMLACWGCKVTMLERSPVMATLLQDALTRAFTESEWAQKLSLLFIHTDAFDYFNKLELLNNTYYPDVIYLDPMHPVRSKSALVKKEMRLVREIVGEDKDSDDLLVQALHYATSRVVVKRPRLAPALANLKPDFCITGKQQRFDVYLSLINRR